MDSPPQLRSLGWKIQARCFSSSVAQPASRPSVRANAVKRCQRFMSLTDMALRKKFSRAV